MKIRRDERRQLENAHASEKNTAPREEKKNHQASLISLRNRHALFLSVQQTNVSIHWQADVIFSKRHRSGSRTRNIIQLGKLAALVERVPVGKTM
jgi:hypothetical protein